MTDGCVALALVFQFFQLHPQVFTIFAQKSIFLMCTTNIQHFLRPLEEANKCLVYIKEIYSEFIDTNMAFQLH